MVMVLAILAGPAQASATRYAAPGGSPADDCHSEATACDLATAIAGTAGNLPTSGEEVIVEPGNYSLASTIDENVLDLDLNVHGVVGQPRPVIEQTNPAGELKVSGGALSYLDFEGGGTNVVNFSGGVMDRVIMRGAGNGNFVCQCGRGLVRNSVFTSTGPTGPLGVTSNGGTSSLTLRNVTAIATDPNAIALEVIHSGMGSAHYEAYNAIARNTAGGADAGAFGTTGTITLHHSNYGTVNQGSGGIVQDAPGDPHQTAAPLFTNGAAGDFSEVLGSPTIDAGLADPSNGPLDFAGNPRSVGGSVDIGAYEFAPAPSYSLGATKVRIKRSGKGSLPLSCTTPVPGDQCVVTGNLTAAVSKKHAKRARAVGVGQVTGTVPAGGTGALLVKLSKKGVKALFAKGKLRTALAGGVTNSAGASTPLSATLILKPKGRRAR
jgi:hypothetical protein